MLKDFFLVGCGSFVGGGMRFLISKWIQSLSMLAFPFGTMTINILGCLIVGFLSDLPLFGNLMNPTTKLILITGFCGGFTTFSTFMNENSSFMKDENYFYMALYAFGSLALGLLAIFAGQLLAKML